MAEVGHLRQQSAKADAVRRGHRHVGLEGGIAQRAFHETLAVVEASLHPQCTHVAAKAAQLVGLAWRYAVVGVKNGNAHTGQVMEGGTHGRTGIARSRNKNGQRPIAFATQAGQAGGKETCSEVLEGCRRSVKELEHVGAVDPQLATRRGMRKGFRTDGRQVILERIAVEKRLEHAQRRTSEVTIRRGQGHARHRLGNVKPTIGRDTRSDGIGKACGRGAAARTDIAHGQSTRAAGPSTGATRTSLSWPAVLNAARMSCDAASADARSSNQPKTLGPAPEMLAPIAP